MAAFRELEVKMRNCAVITSKTKINWQKLCSGLELTANKISPHQVEKDSCIETTALNYYGSLYKTFLSSNKS